MSAWTIFFELGNTPTLTLWGSDLGGVVASLPLHQWELIMVATNKSHCSNAPFCLEVVWFNAYDNKSVKVA
jgi:hypothetical protein